MSVSYKAIARIASAAVLLLAFDRIVMGDDGSRVIVTITPDAANYAQARWRINDTIPIPPNSCTGVEEGETAEVAPTFSSRWLRSDEPLIGVPDGFHVIESLTSP